MVGGFIAVRPRPVYYLRARRKYRTRNPATGRLVNTVCIHKRPAEVGKREAARHWEADTVIGPRGTKACLFTVVERKTRLQVVLLVADRRAQTVARALCRTLPAQAQGLPILSITSDNGKEFAHNANAPDPRRGILLRRSKIPPTSGVPTRTATA
jgi:IS30 family transposase